MKFGIKNSDIDYILSVLVKFSEIKDALIFGSRAMGNYKKSSDIDLCIKGDNIDINTLSVLKANLEDKGPIPYMFDIVNYKDITVADFRNHIDQFGISIFEHLNQPKN